MVFLIGIGLGVGGGMYLAPDGSGPAEQAEAGPTPEAAAEAAHAARVKAPDVTLLYALTAADRLAAVEAPAAEPDPPAIVEEDTVPPAWQRYAVPVPAHPPDAPRVAIIVDDLGVNQAAARQALELPAPMTFSFMTYAPALAAVAEKAREAGHELMLHVPMEPHSDTVDPGPKVLRGDQGEAEMLARLEWGLERLSGYVGINNHMGSRFTTDEAAMRAVLEVLHSRGLLFLDSKTDPDSLGERLAAEIGVPHAGRDVFLDNDRDPAAIRARLDEVERIARTTGSAIAIAHPYAETYEALHDWVPEARARGVVLVPVSALVTVPEDTGSDLAEVKE